MEYKYDDGFDTEAALKRFKENVAIKYANVDRLVAFDRQKAMMNPASTGIIHIKQLMEYLRGHFRLDWNGVHGSGHWARVLLNGTKLAHMEGARLDVITLFAFLHDHERVHEDTDFEHGPNACVNAHNLRNVYFEIDDEGFALLLEAMNGHSNGTLTGDITVQCCYDADRLDLGRVGIMPDPRYLCTNTAKNPTFLEAAYERSIR
jgi:uncharacterized protein